MAFILPIIVLLAVPAAGQLSPTTPGPTDKYNAGTDCDVNWNVDLTGQWTNVTIMLMSGSNTAMEKVALVESGLDGTDASLTPYSWTCPDVSLNSAIYFYQFTNGEDQMGSTWTTRFTIASSSGEVSPPEHVIQPNGDAIPWGSGSIQREEEDDEDPDTADTEDESDTGSISNSSNSKPTASSSRTKDSSVDDDSDQSIASVSRMHKTRTASSDTPTAGLPPSQSTSTHPAQAIMTDPSSTMSPGFAAAANNGLSARRQVPAGLILAGSFVVFMPTL